MIVLEELNLILLQMVRHILYFFYYLRTFGNWGQFPFGKVGIRDNVPSGKDLFGKMGFGIFGKLGFVKLGFGIISLREIRYFGQMFHSGNLLFGIIASGKVTLNNYSQSETITKY